MHKVASPTSKIVFPQVNTLKQQNRLKLEVVLPQSTKLAQTLWLWLQAYFMVRRGGHLQKIAINLQDVWLLGLHGLLGQSEAKIHFSFCLKKKVSRRVGGVIAAQQELCSSSSLELRLKGPKGLLQRRKHLGEIGSTEAWKKNTHLSTSLCSSSPGPCRSVSPFQAEVLDPTIPRCSVLAGSSDALPGRLLGAYL